MEVAFKGLELCHDKQVGSEAQNELTTCFEGHKNVIISHVGVQVVERNDIITTFISQLKLFVTFKI